MGYASDPYHLYELALKINKINKDNGWEVIKPEDWEDSRRIPTIIALIHSEVSEALEAFRKGDYENFKEEIADVIIRCLDCCGGLEIKIDEDIRKKLEKNKTRGYKHGGKKI